VRLINSRDIGAFERQGQFACCYKRGASPATNKTNRHKQTNQKQKGGQSESSSGHPFIPFDLSSYETHCWANKHIPCNTLYVYQVLCHLNSFFSGNPDRVVLKGFYKWKFCFPLEGKSFDCWIVWGLPQSVSVI